MTCCQSSCSIPAIPLDYSAKSGLEVLEPIEDGDLPCFTGMEPQPGLDVRAIVYLIMKCLTVTKHFESSVQELVARMEW